MAFMHTSFTPVPRLLQDSSMVVINASTLLTQRIAVGMPEAQIRVHGELKNQY